MRVVLGQPPPQSPQSTPAARPSAAFQLLALTGRVWVLIGLFGLLLAPFALAAGITPGVTCPTRALWGFRCPGCGLTRSFSALGRGDLAGSFSAHPFGALLYVTIAAMFVYGVIVWVRRRNLGSQPQSGPGPSAPIESIISWGFLLLVGAWLGWFALDALM